MAGTDAIRATVAKRAATGDGWRAGVERCRVEPADALAEDLDAARRFLLEDRAADEASWVSEACDDIVPRTQGPEYVDLLRKSAERFPEESERHRMAENLDIAMRPMPPGQQV